jgi:hypothetical protein
LPDASHVDLGPYEDRAREVLWGMKSLSDFPEFQVICQRYTPGPVDTRKMYSSPVVMRGPDFFSYGFSMIGFHFIAKVDRRPFPPIYAPFVRASVSFRLPDDILKALDADDHIMIPPEVGTAIPEDVQARIEGTAAPVEGTLLRRMARHIRFGRS